MHISDLCHVVWSQSICISYSKRSNATLKNFCMTVEDFNLHFFRFTTSSLTNGALKACDKGYTAGAMHKEFTWAQWKMGEELGGDIHWWLLNKQTTKCSRNLWTSIGVEGIIVACPVLTFPRFPLVTTAEDRRLG